MKQENINHWYDGWLYDKFIAPNQDVTFVQMMRMMDVRSNEPKKIKYTKKRSCNAASLLILQKRSAYKLLRFLIPY